MSYDYKKIYPFKWFVLENFPFIEADFDALTNWQLFCKLGKEMNKIINAVNGMGIEVENIAEYFDNLDLQEEINNKLDEMAESGELEEIIAEYLNVQSVLAYNTLNDLKDAENLIDGSFTRIYGKETYNDGLGAFYKIRELAGGDVIDDDILVSLTNYPTLVAEKMPETLINNLNTKIGTLSNLQTVNKTNLVTAINEVKNAQYNLIPFAGIIRPTSEGWILLNDSGHQPLNIQSVAINGGRLQINHDMNASKVIAFNISPDEAFSRFGIHAGASVGVDTSLISFAIDTTATAYIRYTAQNGFQLQADYSNNIHSIAWDSDNSKLTITFTDQLSCKQYTDWKASYNNADNMNNFKPYVTYASPSSATVEVYNTAGVKQTSPAAFDRLFVSVKYAGPITASALVDHPVSNANFFISGWMLA